MMSLVRAQLGEPQQSSLLTALFSFLSKFTAKSGEKVSVKKTVLWTVFSELGLSEGCLRTNRSKRGSYLPSLQSKLGEPQQSSLLTTLFSFFLNGSMSIVGVTLKIEYLIITSGRELFCRLFFNHIQM